VIWRDRARNAHTPRVWRPEEQAYLQRSWREHPKLIRDPVHCAMEYYFRERLPNIHFEIYKRLSREDIVKQFCKRSFR